MNNRKLILVIISVLMTISASAQKLTIGYLYPAGGQTGETVEIEAGGLNINKATKVIFNHSGIKGEIFPFEEKETAKKKRKRLNDQSSPQLADKIKIKISIASNVPGGMYELRLQSPQGVSNMLPFEVCSYPNYLESGKSSMKSPDTIEALPVVLCGQMTPGGVDYFKFTASKGEKMVASVKGRSLVPYIADAVPGWFQPVVKILDSKGHEVAYSDDYQHNVDPLIIIDIPKDDTYTLIIHDAIYRGRQDFNYRIQLGTLPVVTGRYPAYGIVGKKVKQQIYGVNLNTDKATITVKKAGFSQIAHTTKYGTSNPVSFYALPKGTILTQFPEDGKQLSIYSAISDSLTRESKVKEYKITAQKGQPLFIELIGRRNGSKIDAKMRLLDKRGRVLAEADDSEDPTQGLMTFHADPVLKYIPRQGGELTLTIEDLHRGHGMDYHYLLRMHKQMPSFNAFVSPANISIPSGGTASFRVDIEGKIKRPANIVIDGLAKGFTTSCLQLQNGKSWEVSITSPKDAELKSYPLNLMLEYSSTDGMGSSDILPADNMMQAFYYIHRLPAASFVAEVSEASPYRMSVEMDLDKAIPLSFNDETIPVKILINKDAGFNEDIALELGKKSSTFTLEPISIKPEETEKTIFIKVNKNSLAKYKSKKYRPTWQMSIVGTVKGEIVKQGKRTFQNAKYREMTPLFLIKLED